VPAAALALALSAAFLHAFWNLLIARAKERRVKRNGPGQLSHVLAIDGTVPDELGEG